VKTHSKELLQQRLVTAEVALAHAREVAATAKLVMLNEEAEVDRLQEQLDRLKEQPTNQSDVD